MCWSPIVQGQFNNKFLFFLFLRKEKKFDFLLIFSKRKKKAHVVVAVTQLLSVCVCVKRKGKQKEEEEECDTSPQFLLPLSPPGTHPDTAHTHTQHTKFFYSAGQPRTVQSPSGRLAGNTYTS
jgi:hypothetical protein